MINEEALIDSYEKAMLVIDILRESDIVRRVSRMIELFPELKDCKYDDIAYFCGLSRGTIAKAMKVINETDKRL
jgi:predicted transcriptional regulator